PRDPGEQRFVLEPVQDRRDLAWDGAALLDLIKAAAVYHPEVALEPRAWLRRRGQCPVQPDEVEGAADPGDAGDEMGPAQQQIRPIGEPTGHGGSNFTVKLPAASPRRFRQS